MPGVGQLEVETVPDHWSDAEVYRVADGSAYLKVSSHDAWYGARAEAERLAWVEQRAPHLCPAWSRFVEDETKGYLLTAAVEGTPLYHRASSEPDEVAGILAAAIRAVHDAFPTGECPFDLRPSFLLQHSAEMMRAGRVDDEYCEEVSGLAPDEAFTRAVRMQPADDANLVVLHGDTYARNLLVDEHGGFRWVDWGWLGVGHRWHDLGTAITWIERHCGHDRVGVFLDAYGAERDEGALTFFRMLDGLR